MDESWGMRMGKSDHSRQRSFNRKSNAEDFTDVFGGPPRAVFSRKLSADFSNYTSFYDEIFQGPEKAAPVRKKSGRSLRAFCIPATKNDEFYSDIFGSDQVGRSRDRSRASSKGKSSSSSVLSSEDLSPLRSTNGEDVEVSSFPSNLRPIHIPCRWNSSTMKPSAFPCNSPSGSENQYTESFAYNKSSYHGFSSQNLTSPDMIKRSTKVSASDLDHQSSSSSCSSLCQEWEDKTGFLGNDGNDRMQEQEQDDDEDEDEDEVMSSYVIEINSDHYREDNDDAIDEAVAWAKERYQRHSPEKESDMQERSKEGVRTDHKSRIQDEELDKCKTEAKKQSQYDMELKLLKKEVELWSSGKKTNIRLLLSSLHQILWPDSSWHAVPLKNLTDSSLVKKAYQKAQLCLHPDKLQQRRATPTQKYVAAEVFAILQDAWDAFITQDVLLIRG